MDNILRQIRDFQAQADRIINTKDGLNSYEDLAKYSDEIKNYLLENIKDEFILNYIKSIPNIKEEEKSKPKSDIIGILSIFGGIGLFSYYKSLKKNEEILNSIRDLKNKYSSLKLLIKNYY